jgi:hypothetical protein
MLRQCPSASRPNAENLWHENAMKNSYMQPEQRILAKPFLCMIRVKQSLCAFVNLFGKPCNGTMGFSVIKTSRFSIKVAFK